MRKIKDFLSIFGAAFMTALFFELSITCFNQLYSKGLLVWMLGIPMIILCVICALCALAMVLDL